MIEKSKVYTVIALVDYAPGSAGVVTITKKSTGDITVLAFDAGVALAEKISPFDIFIQILEGRAEIVIGGKPYMAGSGEMVIVPAHAALTVRAIGRFKIIRAVIKSGYGP